MRINVLPKQISELIAAGEVVERPASVVKELVENSVDAGATAVTVEIRHGGITYIRVTDNGCGIDREDVPKAFLSHATSKISTAADLDSILTLGFRGEALPSIASVSKVEVFTRTEGSETGTLYRIDGSGNESIDSAGCPLGTTVIVRDLFFNTPARMKFLKKDVSEANAVSDVIDRIALSHPEISFRFIREDRQALLTPGDGKLLSAAHCVLGREVASSLIPAHYEYEGVTVDGYVSKPLNARASRSMQYFFLNGRYIRSRMCSSSLENAYKNTIMVGKFPVCVLAVSVSPDLVDVNVHPTKTEARFSDERRVASSIYFAASGAIASSDTRPSLDLSRGVSSASADIDLHRIKQYTGEHTAKPQKNKEFFSTMTAEEFRGRASRLASPKAENPFLKQEDEPDLIGAYVKTRREERANEEDTAPAEPVDTDEQRAPDIVSEEKTAVPSTDKIRYVGEAFSTYIIVQNGEKLCLIDKHAAHERIIFNKLRKERENVTKQFLLEGAVLRLTGEEYDVLTRNASYLEKCGFLTGDYGDNTVILRSCPMMLDAGDSADTVLEIVRNLASGRVDAQTDRIDDILHTTACKAAIKAGNKNTPDELTALAVQVIGDPEVRYCPHGRPVLIELTRYDLEKQFRRIQS